MGNWTYELSHGYVWNARKLRHIYEPTVQVEQDFGMDIIPVPEEIVAPPPLRRSARPNKGQPPRRYSPSHY